MPRAVVSKLTERFNLTTVPPEGDEEGGWVELRRLSYGEKIAKDSEAMKLRFSMDTKNKGKSRSTDVDAEVAVVNEIATMLEFAKCIVSHNLYKPGREGEPDILLDFSKVDDVKLLDPRVGQEISELIGDMNDFDKQASESEVDSEGK